MKIDWKKVAVFFGMPDATEAEVDARLDAELTTIHESADEQGADAGATEVTEAEHTETVEEAIDLGDVQAQLDTAMQAITQLGAEVQALTTRLERVEESPAAEETAGKTEAAELADNTPTYALNPVNARVGAMLSGKK